MGKQHFLLSIRSWCYKPNKNYMSKFINLGDGHVSSQQG